MQPMTRYSVEATPTEPGSVTVLRDGTAVATKLPGQRLEAQFELRDGRSLLWITDDSPYDEGLHVYLVDAGGHLEDAVEAEAPFAPGILRIERTGADWVEFQFFKNDQRYRLTVTDPRWRFRLPAGWSYRPRLGVHRLRVETA